MSNIYLKVTIETFSKLRFSGLNFKTSCCNLKIRGVGAKRVWLFYYFNFERNYAVLKSKSLLSKNINFSKNETESKMENPTHSFRELNLVLRQINRKSKVKL